MLEIGTELFGDDPGLGRTDAFDLRVIRQVVGEPAGVHLPVKLHAGDLELEAVLGMLNELAMEHERLVLLNHHISGKLHPVAALGYESPG